MNELRTASSVPFKHKKGVEAYCLPHLWLLAWPIVRDKTIDTTPEDNIKRLHPMRASVKYYQPNVMLLPTTFVRFKSARIRDEDVFNNTLLLSIKYQTRQEYLDWRCKFTFFIDNSRKWSYKKWYSTHFFDDFCVDVIDCALFYPVWWCAISKSDKILIGTIKTIIPKKCHTNCFFTFWMVVGLTPSNLATALTLYPLRKSAIAFLYSSFRSSTGFW